MSSIKEALRTVCATYALEPVAVYRRGTAPTWPLEAKDEDDLQRQLVAGGHFLPLPKEPAALANILETSVCSHVTRKLHELYGIESLTGTERGYPDLEIVTRPADAEQDRFYAVDIKVARLKPTKRGRSQTKTQSRITLYTGNTYFRHPDHAWPGMSRPFAEYAQHLDIIVLYNLSDANHRVEDIELLVCEPWQIASKRRSSTTREYIGAVDDLRQLREMKGEFESQEAFYAYWRNYKFKTPAALEAHMRKVLAAAAKA
jgi:hypothetical protein